MELRQLATFVAVAEEGSFTRAAQRLHVVQSAVSAAVKALERDVGALLLDRGPRHVTLTDAGAALLPRAREVLETARDARDAVDAVGRGLRGTVRVGTLTSVGVVDVAAVLGEFHRRHPGVELRLSTDPAGSAGLLAALVERRLDLAFVSTPAGAPGLGLTELARAPLDLVLPRGHRLARRRTVAVAELADLDFVDFPLGYGNRAVVDRAFASAGVPRRVAVEITDLGTGADYVRHGLGVALLPHFAVPSGTGLVVVPVTGADLDWRLFLAVPQDRRVARATQALADLVLECAPQQAR